MDIPLLENNILVMTKRNAIFVHSIGLVSPSCICAFTFHSMGFHIPFHAISQFIPCDFSIHSMGFLNSFHGI